MTGGGTAKGWLTLGSASHVMAHAGDGAAMAAAKPASAKALVPRRWVVRLMGQLSRRQSVPASLRGSGSGRGGSAPSGRRWVSLVVSSKGTHSADVHALSSCDGVDGAQK